MGFKTSPCKTKCRLSQHNVGKPGAIVTIVRNAIFGADTAFRPARTASARSQRVQAIARASVSPSRFRTEWWEGTFKIRTSLTESNQD
jgi:hypothetical protein